MNKFGSIPLTKAQKLHINNGRKQAILEFLSNELWSTADNLSLLIKVKHPEYTRRLMSKMVEDGLILKNTFASNEGKRTAYLLSDMGYIEVGFDAKLIRFPKISSQSFTHNEKVQRLKILSLLSNKTWQSEREIQKLKLYTSYPDGLLIINETHKISIELQRNRYSLEALKNKITKCLSDCLSNKFNKVLFICADNLNSEVMKRALFSIQVLKGKDHRDIFFSEEYKSKFEFINYDEFGLFLKNIV